MERTVIQELAFPATEDDASSAQLHSLTRPMDANRQLTSCNVGQSTVTCLFHVGQLNLLLDREFENHTLVVKTLAQQYQNPLAYEDL